MAARFKDFPHSAFIDRVVEHVRETGEPETFEDLHQGPLPKDAKYRIVRRIDIDRKKRPTGDRATCPMCTPNRFLEGRLVWLPELECASVIGHCCAVHADQAEREFKRREDQRREEDFLLAALPMLKDKTAALSKLRPAAEEALRLFRKFRTGAPEIQGHLRTIKDRGNAQLRTVEILRSQEDENESDDVGPAGFRGRGEFGTESRDHYFGMIAGTTALLKDYNPIKELNDAQRMCDLYPFDGGEAEALELIAGMTEKERRASVANLQNLERQYAKFIKRITDFAVFFSADNIARLHAYGTDQHGHFTLWAERKIVKGRLQISLRHDREECRVIVADRLFTTGVKWPAVEL